MKRSGLDISSRRDATFEEFYSGIESALEKFSIARVLVLGDIMLDQFVWGEVSRISPEAPVPVVDVQKETMLLGGAANVANNLRALGARCGLAGIIGQDAHGEIVRSLAQQQEIDVSCLIPSRRPTTLKTRIVARGQQVVRVDRESRTDLSGNTAERLVSAVCKALPEIDIVIVSDYNKGVVSKKVMQGIWEAASVHNVPVLVDPKPDNAHLYRGVTLLTPNNLEAEIMAGIRIETDQDVERAAGLIGDKLSASGVLITRGPKGMALWQRKRGIFSIPTAAREVFDVTGAGDTVISTAALGLVSGLDMRQAAWLANLAAGIVVGKVGTATVSVQEIRHAMKDGLIQTDSDL